MLYLEPNCCVLNFETRIFRENEYHLQKFALDCGLDLAHDFDLTGFYILSQLTLLELCVRFIDTCTFVTSIHLKLGLLPQI